MKVYVAGALDDAERVQAVQAAVVAAGHQLSLDWTRESDVTFVNNYASDLALSAKIAAADLDAVLDADAVLVVASEHEGSGMPARPHGRGLVELPLVSRTRAHCR